MRAISLVIWLCLFWAVSSGEPAPLLLIAMVVSAVLVTAFCARLRTLDAEGHPVHLLPRIAGLWLWLLPRVVRANFTVARLVLSRRPALRPRVVRMKMRQRDDLGRAILANCVTWTPGTVALTTDADTLLIHGIGAQEDLTSDAAETDRRLEAIITGGRGQ